MFASFLFAGFDATIICNIIHELSKDNVYVEKSRLKKLIRETESPYSEQFLSLLRQCANNQQIMNNYRRHFY